MFALPISGVSFSAFWGVSRFRVIFGACCGYGACIRPTPRKHMSKFMEKQFSDQCTLGQRVRSVPTFLGSSCVEIVFLLKVHFVPPLYFVQRAENGGLDPSWLGFAFLGHPDFQSRGPQNACFKGFCVLWTENWGAPKTQKSTTTDPSTHSRPSEQKRELSSAKFCPFLKTPNNTDQTGRSLRNG